MVVSVDWFSKNGICIANLIKIRSLLLLLIFYRWLTVAAQIENMRKKCGDLILIRLLYCYHSIRSVDGRRMRKSWKLHKY